LRLRDIWGVGSPVDQDTHEELPDANDPNDSTCNLALLSCCSSECRGSRRGRCRWSGRLRPGRGHGCGRLVRSWRNSGGRFGRFHGPGTVRRESGRIRKHVAAGRHAFIPGARAGRGLRGPRRNQSIEFACGRYASNAERGAWRSCAGNDRAQRHRSADQWKRTSEEEIVLAESSSVSTR
jgi:hypothetical protein